MSGMRTIIMTNRPPILIIEADWPTIAATRDQEFGGQYEFQAHVVSKWYLGVRQHRDGHLLVYATYSYSANYQHARNYHAGVLTQSHGIVDAIHTVCATMVEAEHADYAIDKWRTLRDECIANLPTVAT